jgi:alkaline phosphatase D
VLLSGDQHLATLVHHGLEGYDDGIVQFSVPAAGTHFQRWFEPPALRDSAYTGRFTDYHGNRYTMLAVANPTISFADYREHIPSGNRLLDRRLKSDGYGIVRVDKPSRRVTLECWPWDADPLAGGEQYAGWPYQVQL